MKEAMRSWGLAVVIVLVPLIVVGSLAFTKGGMWIEAKIAVEKSYAETNHAVAKVVNDLADNLHSTQQNVDKLIASSETIIGLLNELVIASKVRESPGTDSNDKVISLLEELVAVSKVRQQP